MAKDQYNPHETEAKWQEYWKKNNVFSFDQNADKEVYSIDTPPPYASAAHLHVGHGMHYSQFEFIARFQRMLGKNVFFPMGYDDNGLPTERYVEKVHHVDKSKVSRKEFIALCLEETKKAGKNYYDLFTQLGFSIDWSLLYQTIGPRARRVAQLSFLDLHKKRYLERTDRPTMWCTFCQTTIAQADLDDLERSGTLYHVKANVKGTEEFVTFATTRPELMMACIAITVHPSDKRYEHLVGKTAVIPGSHAEVPILADEMTKMDFGSGVVYWCPFGDMNDIEFVAKHPELEVKIILNPDGTLNEFAGKYEGMTALEARKAVLSEWRAENVIEREESINQVVNVHERCKTPVEFLRQKQWQIKVLDQKDRLIAQGRKVNWYPDHMRVRYEHWVQNLKWNWGISRQRYFGVPFPVWYCDECSKVLLPDESQLPVDPREEQYPKGSCTCGSTKISPEMDVMDTWMTSSLTPEINADWGGKERKNFLPMSLRPQAHDIIRTWAFYTIVKSYFHHKRVPWNDIMISGHGLDEKGKKISKSAGNFIVAQDVIKKYSADAFRFWAAETKLGEDLRYQEKDVATGQKLLVKLYNAARFVFMQLSDFDRASKPELTTIDRWLMTKLHKLIVSSTKQWKEYDYSRPKAHTEQFFWHQFCDLYLEIVKDRFYDEKRADQKPAAQYGLYHALFSVLQLFAPIMPHITEELYHKYYWSDKKIKSVHVTSWPAADDFLVDEQAEKIGDFAVQVIEAARKYKSEKKVSLKTPVTARIVGPLQEDEWLLIVDDVKGTIKAQDIQYTFTEEIKSGPVEESFVFEIIQTS
ncbi:valine--tRNA ligase [Candidatus Woesearchaeota archaeon]|nr:valine--tRNA ligase [Candidatus Woesearchaeota archaeon]